MKKIIFACLMALILSVGCSNEQNITFEAEIESLSDNNMIVITQDDVGFDKASVEIGSTKVQGDLAVGKKVSITIQPEVRETYPVQVTAREVKVKGGSYQKITVEAAKTLIDNGDYDVLLDVRTLEEYNEGHLEDSTLLPDNEIKEKAESILSDKNEVILVYCRSGRRSSAASKELIKMGYNNVYDLGGIIDWPYEVVIE